MKGDHLGEFEELALLAVRAVGEEAYAVPVQHFAEQASGRRVSLGAVYAALDRLERKGLLRSAVGEPTPQPGGKRKRCYGVTPLGMRTLREVRRVRERLWRAIEAER
jgi:DNA-binding PadR family transcriptional regulator